MTEEQTHREAAIRRMTDAISEILWENQPSIYLYGSAVLEDFRLGWSDLDILVLTRREISQEQAGRLVNLRQSLLEGEPENRYYRSFEGGMLTLEAFLSGGPDRVVYWGTSGQRIARRYRFDSFCMTELIQAGRLLAGADLRQRMKLPEYADLCRDIRAHYEGIRQYAQTTDRGFYSFGWLLDIARGLYTLREKAVTAKTRAGEWALARGLCPAPEALETALRVRKDPPAHAGQKEILDYAETLGPAVQRFADVLENELAGAGF